MALLMKPQTVNYARSPTLETVLMIEKAIEQRSGECNKTQLWKSLPRKVMWQTYLVALDYLASINKIVVSRNGILVYIWNPKLARKMRNRREIKL
jgi:hypothetical protein